MKLLLGEFYGLNNVAICTLIRTMEARAIGLDTYHSTRSTRCATSRLDKSGSSMALYWTGQSLEAFHVSLP